MEDFSLFMNPPEEDTREQTLYQKALLAGHKVKTRYAAITSYTGDGTVIPIVFDKEEDAIIQCKKAFEIAIKDAKENEGFESIIDWDASGHYGAINWCDGEQSRFEVIEAPYVCSKICNEVLTAEFDKERSV